MSVNRSDLRTSLRDLLGAWPDFTTTVAEALDATETGVDLAAVTNLAERSLIEVDSEVMRTISISSLTATVMRGDKGTTAATHSNGATAKFYPNWGWSDVHLNRQIEKAISWLGEGMVWSLVPVTNTWLADAKQFGLTSGDEYPNGNIVKRIELWDENLGAAGDYREILGWRHIGDRIELNQQLTENTAVRLWVQRKQALLTDDSTNLDNDKYREPLVNRAAGLCLDELLANRTRFYEYSATLNDRASTPDELQRTAYYFKNQALIERDGISRPGLSGFAAIQRPGL